MDKKWIFIYMDKSDISCMSYKEVQVAMDDGLQHIDTCCLNFFSSEILDKDYDVVVIKEDKYVFLSNLFNEKLRDLHTDRAIKKGHNLVKLLLAGEFQFRTITEIGERLE